MVPVVKDHDYKIKNLSRKTEDDAKCASVFYGFFLQNLTFLKNWAKIIEKDIA
jgi:hypothetical protein